MSNLSIADINRIEQKTLTVSLYAVIFSTIISFTFGLYIGADIVILNAIFALLSIIAAGVSVLATKLVNRPADRNFQFGYFHIEPLVHTFNGFLMFITCLYGLLNGIESIRHGGHTLDSNLLLWFSGASALFCLGMWIYKRSVSRQISSEFLKNDTRKWIIKLVFNATTLLGFTMLYLLPSDYASFWARYMDSALVVAMALILFPIPLKIIIKNMRAILHMVSSDQALVDRVEGVIKSIAAEPGVLDYSTHIVEIGKVHLIEVHFLVNDEFQHQTIASQDALRAKIWNAIQRQLHEVEFSLSITADKKWI